MSRLGTARVRVVNQLVGWGRGVYVVGMHRSGTSAVTRMINLVGPALGDPADLIAAMPDSNPTGHWESTALTEINDRILEALGGTWSAPPRFTAGWTSAAEVAALKADARTAFARTYASREWAWKDPRVCLTLPFWRRYLPAQQVALLVTRHPLEIAASLRHRNGFPDARGLALWETYMRHAIENVAGLPVLVTSYEDLLTDPGSWAQRAFRFLRDHGFRASAPKPEAITAFIDPSLRHAEAAADRWSGMTPAQKDLYRLLRGLEPEYESMPALELPPMDPEPSGVLAADSADSGPAAR